MLNISCLPRLSRETGSCFFFPALVVGYRFSSAMIGLFLLALLLTYVFPAALPGVLIKPGYQQSSTPPRRLHTAICLACELALVFRMRCATPFLGTTAYYTIGSCLWKKLLKTLYYCLVFLSLQCCLPIFPLSSLSVILDIIAKINACSDWNRLYCQFFFFSTNELVQADLLNFRLCSECEEQMARFLPFFFVDTQEHVEFWRERLLSLLSLSSLLDCS